MFIKSEMSSFCRHFSKSFQRNGSRDFGHVDVVHVRKTALLAAQVEEIKFKQVYRTLQTTTTSAAAKKTALVIVHLSI